MKKLFISLLLLTSMTAAFSLSNLITRVSFEPEAVHNIDFNLLWENLIVQASDDSEITIEIYANNEKYAPRVFVSYNTLQIETIPLERTFKSAFASRECKVVAKIPANHNLEKTVLRTVSSSIKVQNLYSENAIIISTSGSIFVEGCFTQSLEISSTSGTIGAELQALPSKSSTINTTSGTIYVSVPGDSDFTVYAKTKSGSFTNAITREKLGSMTNYKKILNGGGAKMSLSSVSGSITLDSSNGILAKGTDFIDDDFGDGSIPVVSFDDPIF